MKTHCFRKFALLSAWGYNSQVEGRVSVFDWLKKIIRHIAEEVHKSKIAELEKKILEMGQDHKVYQERIDDCKSRIKELEQKLSDVSFRSNKMEGAFDTLKYLREKESLLRLGKEDSHD